MKTRNIPVITPLGSALAVLLVLLPWVSPVWSVGPVDEELLSAARRGDLAPARARLDKGADVNAKTKRGWTALMWAAYRGHTDLMQLLIERGADVHTEDYFGTTAMLNAAWQRGNLASIELLLDNGADINAKNLYGVTALKMAVDRGELDLVRFLLDNGADVNARLKDGSTPLMWATIPGREEVAKLLLSRGADVHAKAKNDSTALTWAALVGNADLEILLRTHGAEMTLSLAVILRDTREAQRLLHEGADVNARDEYGRSPLMDAAKNGDLKMVRLLVANQADLNAISKPPKGTVGKLGRADYWPARTAFIDAIEGGHTQVVTFLLKSGADVRIGTTSTRTLLNLARSRVHKDIVKILKAYGAEE